MEAKKNFLSINNSSVILLLHYALYNCFSGKHKKIDFSTSMLSRHFDFLFLPSALVESETINKLHRVVSSTAETRRKAFICWQFNWQFVSSNVSFFYIFQVFGITIMKIIEDGFELAADSILLILHSEAFERNFAEIRKILSPSSSSKPHKKSLHQAAAKKRSLN